ncbi:uncharacterized protein LOC136064490 [Quercus suber]|uniref:uncharacterized protein LOC136064490 n=1 Tax=Quercus suber TaxID=58331 RepID=UPI0032DE2D03
MATTNDVQGEEPPMTALERQVQTLAAAVERLTKQNHDLEEQLRRKNAAPNDQQEDQEGTSTPRKNQEKPEGSHAPSKPEKQNLSMPSLTDATPPHIVAKMQAMKEQMEVMMNALKGQVPSDLDDLVNRTDSPFTAAVNSFPLPHKFRIPHIDSYDGVKDPVDHLETFKTLMHLQKVADEIMCRAFPITLKGPARVWFSRLTPNSISTFKELSAQFTTHFIGGHMYKKSTACLMSIKQREDETLRSYITRFNKEALSIDEADDKILVAAFTNGLRKGKFLFSLYNNDLKTMSEVLYRATKYMNAEDALLAREEKPRKREQQEDARQDRDRKDDKRSKPPAGKFTNFTPLIALIDQVLMQIKDEGSLTFPEKLKGDLNKRSRDKYCRFHRDHGYDMADCYDLKQQIETLIRQGKLQKFISKERTD